MTTKITHMEVDDMYLTKVIERFGDPEMVAQSIDDMCNKMDKEGYSLVTYQFYAN